MHRGHRRRLLHHARADDQPHEQPNRVSVARAKYKPNHKPHKQSEFIAHLISIAIADRFAHVCTHVYADHVRAQREPNAVPHDQPNHEHELWCARALRWPRLWRELRLLPRSIGQLPVVLRQHGSALRISLALAHIEPKHESDIVALRVPDS